MLRDRLRKLRLRDPIPYDDRKEPDF